MSVVLDPIALANPVSSSQLETYELCNRKWGIYKLDGIKAESNKFAKRGTEAHSVLEFWLIDGKEIDTKSAVGKIIEPGMRFLPAPKTGLTESEFVFDSERVRFLGKIDWRSKPQQQLVNLRRRQTTLYVVRVIDHKTTTNINKWAKRVVDLIRNPQTILYGIRAIALSPDPDNTIAELDWIYYQDTPDKPKAAKISLHVVPDEIFEEYKAARSPNEFFGIMSHSQLLAAFEEKEATALEMHEHHRQKRKGLDLPFNVAGCYAFGGCPYRGKECKLSSRERLRAHMAQEQAASGTSKLRDRVAALKNKSTAGASAEKDKEKSAPAEESPAARAKAALAARKNGQSAGTKINPPESAKVREQTHEEEEPSESAEDVAEEERTEARPRASVAAKAGSAQQMKANEHAAGALIEAAIQMLENAKRLLG